MLREKVMNMSKEEIIKMGLNIVKSLEINLNLTKILNLTEHDWYEIIADCKTPKMKLSYAKDTIYTLRSSNKTFTFKDPVYIEGDFDNEFLTVKLSKDNFLKLKEFIDNSEKYIELYSNIGFEIYICEACISPNNSITFRIKSIKYV